ncbi:hypothetical protein ACT453_40275, partial [Bacillus sp. D-CC]
TLYLQLTEKNLSWANKPLSKKLLEKERKISEDEPKVAQDLMAQERQNVAGNLSDLEKKRVIQNSDFDMFGKITKVQLPDVTGPINQIYKNSTFNSSTEFRPHTNK